MDLLVKQENAQSVLNYLLSRPYGEVYKLVPYLTNLKPGKELTNSTIQDEVLEARKIAADMHDHTNEK